MCAYMSHVWIYICLASAICVYVRLVTWRLISLAVARQCIHIHFLSWHFYVRSLFIHVEFNLRGHGHSK